VPREATPAAKATPSKATIPVAAATCANLEPELVKTLESISDGFFAVDSEWRFVYVNASAERILGIRRDEVLGLSHWEVFPLTVGSRLEQEYRAAAAGDVRDFENYYEPWQRWFRNRCFPRDGGGMSVYFRDVTAEKKAAADAQQASTLLEAISQNTADVIFAKDSQGRYTYVNPATLAVIGKPEREVIGRTDLEVMNDLDAARRLMATDKRIMQGGVPEEVEEHVPLPDGSMHIWYSQKIPYRNDAGEIIGVLGISRDITERKKVEAEFKRIHEDARFFSKALLESAQPFTSGLPDGRLMMFNDAFAALTGYSREELQSTTWKEDLTAPEWRGHEQTWLQQLHQTGQPQLYEKEYVRKDGSRIPVEIRVHLAGGEDGQPQFYYAFLNDITDRKQAEQALIAAKSSAEEANRAKDQFLAVLSHELRTPLSPVLTATALMMDDPSITAEQRDLLNTIRRSVELEARLIDDLLDLTRISRGKLELHTGDVDLHDKIRKVLAMCESDIRNAKLEVRLTLSAEKHHVHGDAARLQQVFWNLLKNAIKFTPPGGHINLRTSNPAPEQIQVLVEDTGYGIEAGHLPHIFDAFEQGTREVTRQFGGLGLGLAICKALVGLHGGAITAASAGKHHGATFTVTLAAQLGASESGGHQPLTVGPNVPSRHILVVEDHPDTAHLMARLLTKAGHTVRLAHTVAEAAAAIEQESFHLLISDIGLPDGSGLDVIERLRTKSPVPAIALSGYGMEHDVSRSKAAGFSVHLVKPVNIATFRKTVAELLTQSV
jgi:two-component system CheB/CheR fusion protein